MGCCDGLKVNSCCCCISVQTGTKIIGFLVLLGGILSLAAHLLASFVVYDDAPYSSLSKDDQLNAITRDEDDDAYETANVVIYAIIMLGDIITIAIAIVLLVGVFREKPCLLKAFCIVVLVLAILQLVFNILNSIVLGFNAQRDTPYFFNFLFDLYFIVVVKSAYHEMKEGLLGHGGQVMYRTNNSNQMQYLKPLNP